MTLRQGIFVQALNKGIKVEVLDGLAVGLAAMRGEYFTAVAMHGLLTLGEYLEHKTEKHSDALRCHLLKPMPTQTWVEREGQKGDRSKGERGRGSLQGDRSKEKGTVFTSVAASFHGCYPLPG
jgi:cation transport ATPase